MLIGKKSIATAIFIHFLLVGCTTFEEKNKFQSPQEAWWLSKVFTINEDNLFGTPLSEINPEWKLISIFSLDNLKKQLDKHQYRDIQKSSLAFSVERTLEKGTTQEVVFVGVYLSHSGSTGRFIAVRKNQKITRHFTHEGIAGYSSIYQDGNEIRWYKCMECNDYDSIIRVDSDYILK